MDVFRFENFWILSFLFLIPVFIGLFILLAAISKRKAGRMADPSLHNRLFPQKSKSRPIAKLIFFCLSYTFMILALANPQIGSKVERVKRKGVDLMLAIDVSKSMMSEDIQPNRMTRAKQALSKLVDRLDGDRIGIVVFAGKAYNLLAITHDYAAAKMMVSSINYEMVPTQGTAIGEAIRVSQTAFGESQKRNQAIIVITDGENHEDDAIMAAQEAEAEGIYVHTLGMGTAEGGPIPVFHYGARTGYKKDNEGNTVISRLNETMLQQIAAAGGGIYVRANNTRIGLDKIFKEINKMDVGEAESNFFSDYEDRYQYPLALAILFLLIEIIILERKNRYLKNIELFERKGI